VLHVHDRREGGRHGAGQDELIEPAELTFRPPAPYRLAASIGPPDPCRRYRGGVLDIRLRAAGGEPLTARVWQAGDGIVRARVPARNREPAAAALRRLLRLDLDHRPFLELAAGDPLLRPLRGRLAGMRPAVAGSLGQALVRGVAGQLVRSSEAVRFERRIVAGLSRRDADGLRTPPAAADLAAAHPATFERAGLSPARAVALSRLAVLDWDVLAAEPSDRVEARMRALRGIGPWTTGVVCSAGLARIDRGLVGDLGLIRLAGALLGRPAEPEDTAELLAPYGEWAGLASAWLLHHPLCARGRPAPRAPSAITAP
jgi:AraC family transcriptional regulator of adaptative response / DNA-3-methyladenine glycosylase II